MHRSGIIIMAAVCLLVGTNMAADESSGFCLPGMSCFPSLATVAELAVSLDAGLTESMLYPGSPEYANVTMMKNVYYTRFPAYIVLAQSVEDVQKAMLFARKYNLRVTIQSSGHDYIGRSTADGSLMINLSGMKGIDIALNSPLNADGVIRSESGNTWARVYEEVDKQNRIVVGGIAHTVAMGGYTLGGGHSPMSRSLGLGVDNLLAATMVTVDGAVVNVSASGTVRMDPDGNVTRSDDPDLFWAVRGGGGGTFGVVTSFVFKLHKPPSNFGHINCVFRYNMATEQDMARDFIQFYFNLVKDLPVAWGGYFQGNSNHNRNANGTVLYVVSMLHYGPSSLPSFSKIQPLIDYHPEKQALCFTRNYSTFWEYEQTVYNELYKRATLVASFVKATDFDTDMANWIRDMTMVPPSNTSIGSCTNILIGGKVSSVADGATAISANFRAALGCMSCAVVWGNNPVHDKEAQAAANILEDRLQNLSHGVYTNEPPRYMNNWKKDFWGGHYARLLRVKRKWDATNFLTCLYCVGSDLGRNYDKHSAVPIIG